MGETIIRPATEADIDMLDAGLRRLSEGMGDSHRASVADLRRAGFGPRPSFRALLAEVDGALGGLALFSPVFSTMRGAAGLYVSDLWVAEAGRGQGLGRRLLARAAGEAETLWGARFLRLVVYDDNPAAQRFYRRLGLSADRREILMTLDEDGLDALEGRI
ncbi:ribosomal protein S18 acetylase RimI-like enzyme [Rhodovulum iodosum]|uniref:Ribosomal protein S18 acetylase RimI-like enzyme n=1 Tax=Rhodovulum iodosum TaxID=68291 RepID=A0ABV3XWQ9_9RHOB|nr:GNAT family N-acetyltransferase [Rhodovulum robiginosum]RSK34151.1 GNAT family N-acetyltransferase [Rhodovulum robiginosum]